MKNKFFKNSLIFIFSLLFVYLFLYHQKKSYEEYIETYVANEIRLRKVSENMLLNYLKITQQHVDQLNATIINLQYKLRHHDIELFEIKKIKEGTFDNEG